MQAMIDELAKQAAESLGQVSGKETLASFWQEYLSKNGKIPALMKNLRTVAPEERPAMGYSAGGVRLRLAAAWNFLVDIPGGIYGRVHSDRGKSGAGGPDLSRPGRLFEVQQLGVAVPAVFGHRHRFAVGGPVAKGRDEAV